MNFGFFLGAMGVNNVTNHPFGNGNHSTYTNTNGDDWGMVNMALFYSHYQVFLVESLVYSLFTNVHSFGPINL